MIVDASFRTVFRILLVTTVVIFSSCEAHAPHLLVLRGNYNVSRGDYQRAIVDYLKARSEREYEPWIAYNIGNVYHYLGESDAAVDQWTRAGESSIDDLRFGASFNRGGYLLEQGRYEEALERFRYALAMEPSSMTAKRNFEIALERLESASGLSRENTTTEKVKSRQQASSESTATRMLDYIRRKEEQRWRANASHDDTQEENDW